VVQSGNEIPMETPVINENNLLSKKLSELQNTKQHYLNRQQSIEEKITHLRREHHSLIHQDAHYETIGGVEKELSSLISEGAWIQKELVHLTTKMDDIRKCQGC
jgi:chromosome segregation ATPase